MICKTYTWLFGAKVDSVGQHALSFRKRPFRIQHHGYVNNLIHRFLITAEISASKKQQCLSRDDEKSPDGLTLARSQSGRSATWDVTVVDYSIL